MTKRSLRLSSPGKQMVRKRETPQYALACRIRSSRGWQRLRVSYLRRHPVCEDCGETAAVEVHHVKSVAEYPELWNEPSNLRGLCVKCHAKAHSKRK